MTTTQAERVMRELRKSQGWIAEEAFFSRWGWNLSKEPNGVQTPILEKVARYPLFMAVGVARYYIREKGFRPTGLYFDWLKLVESLDGIERNIQTIRGWHYSTVAEVTKLVHEVLLHAPVPDLLQMWLDCPGIHVEENPDA